MKTAFVQDNELLIAITDLADGKYFLEIVHNGEFYVAGFTIGTASPWMAMEHSHYDQMDHESRLAVAAQMLVSLDALPKTNSRNSGSNSSSCCKNGIVAPKNGELLALNTNTNWYLRGAESGITAIPCPIPFLNSLGPYWEVDIYTSNADFVKRRSSYITDTYIEGLPSHLGGELELLINIADLSNGRYFVEVEYDGNFYATGFTIGSNGPTPPSKPKPTSGHK